MKRFLSLTLALVMGLGLMAVVPAAAAGDEWIGDFLVNGTTLKKYYGEDSEVAIPTGITQIGWYAFQDCGFLERVTIPSGVTEIGAQAFQRCTNLTSVTLPSSVGEIGASAFEDCTSLKTAAIPSGVAKVGPQLFQHCTSLTSVTIPSSLTSLGAAMFLGCTGLKSVTIPSGVTEIGAQAFKGCTGLKTVSLPSSVTSIEDSAFEDCAGLTGFTIPSSVTNLGWGVFHGCTGLTDMTIPAGVSGIPQSLFYGCTSLERVAIPLSVASINSNAFYNCTSLTDIYYAGTRAQWKAIGLEAEHYNHAAVHYGSNTATPPTDPDPQEPVPVMVSFDGNGGSSSVLDKILTSGEAYGALPTPTRKGYTFAGWYTSRTGGSKVTRTTIVAATSDHTLYAHWNREESVPKTAGAMPTNDALTSDGRLQNPTVYKINGSNYFKIRDLAAILNGTGKQFSVGYDSGTSSVTVTTGEGYRKLSSDLLGAPPDGNQTATPTNDTIYIDGQEAALTVYKINGGNYFKLRDLGAALDFYVGWTAERGMFIETDQPYDPGG